MEAGFIPAGPVTGGPDHDGATVLPSAPVIRAAGLKRGKPEEAISDRIKLETVFGLTVGSNAALDCDPNTELVTYPAGFRMITKLQARIRGYLVRKSVQCQKKELRRKTEEKRQNWAASVIQALYRGHKIRAAALTADKRVTELRRRWQKGALKSTQESLKQRNEEAMEVLRNMSDIETVIRAFRSLELLTEVFPVMYNNTAGSVVRRVYIYMSVTNRSISSIEVLKSAAALLVNLTRHKVTGPKIYSRDRIPPILKFMWRFSNSETQLFCILCTYLWLFSKYDGIKEDLTEFLNIPENQKMLATIKGNVERMKRMASNTRNKFHTPQTHKFVSHTRHSMNFSMCSNSGKNDSIVLPALEPDYGITRADKPRYFEDAHQAISCLFQTYNL